LRRSVRAGDRLQRVVDALLDLSRAESGALIPDREEIDLASAGDRDVVEGTGQPPRTPQLRVDLPQRTAPGVRRPNDVDHHRRPTW
jgi:signal transduction histidine kinase